jgi:acyl carrier protein
MEASPSVQTVVTRTLPPRPRGGTIEPDEDLVTDGELDSLTLMELVSALEADFGVQLTDDDLVVENFRTIRDIERLVDSKRRAV